MALIIDRHSPTTRINWLVSKMGSHVLLSGHSVRQHYKVATSADWNKSVPLIHTLIVIIIIIIYIYIYIYKVGFLNNRTTRGIKQGIIIRLKSGAELLIESTVRRTAYLVASSAQRRPALCRTNCPGLLIYTINSNSICTS